MHGMVFSIYIWPIILDHGCRNQSFLLTKAIMFLFLSLWAWNLVTCFLFDAKIQSGTPWRAEQLRIALISPLTPIKDTLKFTSVSQTHCAPHTEWCNSQRCGGWEVSGRQFLGAKQRESGEQHVTDVGRGGKLMTGLCALPKCSSGRAQYGSGRIFTTCSWHQEKGLIKLSSFLVIRGWHTRAGNW